MKTISRVLIYGFMLASGLSVLIGRYHVGG